MKGDLPSIPLAAGRDDPPCATEPCSQCCHDIEMLLTNADLRRLAPIAAVRSDIKGRWYVEADDGYLQLTTRPGPPAKGSPGGKPCIFLGADGLCTVWDERPEGCRLYPAIWDEGLREAALDEDYCPHTDGFALPRAANDATRRLAERLASERKARLS